MTSQTNAVVSFSNLLATPFFKMHEILSSKIGSKLAYFMSQNKMSKYL